MAFAEPHDLDCESSDGADVAQSSGEYGAGARTFGKSPWFDFNVR
jgi:hypothetical protein